MTSFVRRSVQYSTVQYGKWCSNDFTIINQNKVLWFKIGKDSNFTKHFLFKKFKAFFKLRKQDFIGTEKWLKRIKNPESSLTKKQVGYYNYLWGIVSSQTNLTLAEKYFKKAISIGLSMNHDLAMAKLSLAGILIQKRRKREATTLLNEAKKIKKKKMLSDQIKMMQQQMKKI